MSNTSEHHHADFDQIYLTDGTPIPEELRQRIIAVQNNLRDGSEMSVAFAAYLKALVSMPIMAIALSDRKRYTAMLAKTLVGLFTLGVKVGYMAANQAIDVDRYLAEWSATVGAFSPGAAEAIKAAFDSGEMPMPGPRYPRTRDDGL